MEFPSLIIENYAFAQVGDTTEVTVEVEMTPDLEAFMDEAWPKALAKLRSICEDASPC